MRLLTILARFGSTEYSSAEEDIAGIFSRRMPAVDRSVIVVDNALPKSLTEERPGRALIGGENQAFEFSAFDRAIDYIGEKIWSYDLIHFATSAFNTLYVAYLDRFDDRVLASIITRPVCIGHIDCYNEAVEVQRFRSQHWIRSCFFVMPPTEAKVLGSFVSIADGTRFFSGDPSAPFRPDAPLSATYQRYITDWLVGRDIGQGVEWHSSLTLSATTLPTFERKALCIMNEQLLGIRLRSLGCRLIDVTWLSTQLARCGSSDMPWHADWQSQLSGRDRDALHLERQSDRFTERRTAS